MATTAYRVSGMTCSHCENSVRQAVMKAPPDRSASASHVHIGERDRGGIARVVENDHSLTQFRAAYGQRPCHSVTYS